MNKYFVHPTAAIEDHVTIGERTAIWHFAHIRTSVVIGSDCILGQNVFIDKNVIVGNGVKIQNNVSLYDGVICEDDVFLGPSMVFTNVINPRAFISRKNEFKQTLVKRGASVGANATIICGVTLGTFCMIGAGAVVTKDVPDFAIVTGNPAELNGWISEFGERLNFDNNSTAKCPHTNDVYELHDGRCQKISQIKLINP